MPTENQDNHDLVKDRHVLVSLDESEKANKAVLYVGDFLGGVPGFRVTLLNIIPEPSEDYFNTDSDKREWVASHRSKALKELENYRKILIQSGFEEDKVSVKVDITKGQSLAESILDEQKKLDCCTVVIGRRGISRKEEFLFGSTSNTILHAGKNCALWVIE
jgi:nucleotide-binding universal stress UspA family protein